MSVGTICIGLYWNVNYAWYLWMFNRYVVHCLAHCATGSVRLARTISGVHAAKWLYRERYDLAGAALQVLPVCVCVFVFVWRTYCLLCQGSCLVAGIQSCGSTLWHFDESLVTVLCSGRTAAPQSGGRRQGGVGGGDTQSRLTGWLNVWTYEKIDLEDMTRGIIGAKVRWGTS